MSATEHKKPTNFELGQIKGRSQDGDTEVVKKKRLSPQTQRNERYGPVVHEQGEG